MRSKKLIKNWKNIKTYFCIKLEEFAAMFYIAPCFTHRFIVSKNRPARIS